jgi:hypothetical protein
MIDVVLFIDGEFDSRTIRRVIPRVGETILIDCGELLEVVEVHHEWSSTEFVQVNTKRIEI